MVEVAAASAAPERHIVVRPLRPADVASLESLIRSVENFSPAEMACAVELVELAAGPPPGADDYKVLVAETSAGGPPVGYACFGPTPMTRSTWDLYWIAVAPSVRGAGCGRTLHAEVERAVRAAGGRRLRVETSSKQDYDATCRFYQRVGYLPAGRVERFYADDDDLLILICEVKD
ncbi:MAG: GNAT family N-acetyltransferase [Deltaproteobacteria bacterium]|nr:GNAT family N-acetyltransferase [Deltaproteobacteria bacterium]